MRFFAIVTAIMVAGVFAAPVPERETYRPFQKIQVLISSADLAVRAPEAEAYGSNWKREDKLDVRAPEAQAYGSNWKREEELEVRDPEAQAYGSNWKRDEDLEIRDAEAQAYGSNWKRYGSNWRREEEEKRDVQEVFDLISPMLILQE